VLAMLMINALGSMGSPCVRPPSKLQGHPPSVLTSRARSMGLTRSVHVMASTFAKKTPPKKGMQKKLFGCQVLYFACFFFEWSPPRKTSLHFGTFLGQESAKTPPNT
jgi:hypothetical protein